jgi:hypothetical protein
MEITRAAFVNCKGGPARAAVLSQARRTAIARSAAKARWAGKGEQPPVLPAISEPESEPETQPTPEIRHYRPGDVISWFPKR